MWACYKGRTGVVEVLLSHGANPSVTGLVGGDTVVTRLPVDGVISSGSAFGCCASDFLNAV